MTSYSYRYILALQTINTPNKRDMENMKAIYMQEEYKKMLKELATQRKQSESSLVRELIAEAHAKQQVEVKK